MGNRRLTSNERRKEILDAALDIIFSEGFYNLTIRNIANKIDLTEAAIYRHFKSKKEIIDCLANLIFSENKVDYETHNPFTLLKKIMSDRMEEFEKNPKLTSIIFQEEIFSEYPDIREKFNEHWKANEESLIKAIKRGQKTGLFRRDIDPQSFAIIYMGSIRMTVFKWKRDNFSYSIKELGLKIINELFKVLKA